MPKNVKNAKSNNTNTKPKKEKKKVSVTCQKCSKTFQITKSAQAAAKRTMFCKACRKAHALANNKGKKPVNQVVVPTGAIAVPSDSNRQLSLSRAARSVPMRSMTARTSSSRLLMSQLNPAATQGSRSVGFDIDQMALPKKSFRYDSTFQVRGPERSNFKVLFLNSPLVIAHIVSDQELAFSGVRFITVPMEDGRWTYYIFGNKTGFIGDVDNRFVFTPKPDWSQYRGLAMSGSATWVGKQLDKNGTYYVARITDEEQLNDFDVLSKADNVVCPIDDMISFTGVHNEPTYPFDHIDDNDGAIIDPARPAETFEEVLNVVFGVGQLGAFSYKRFEGTVNAKITATQVSNFLRPIFIGNVDNGRFDLENFFADLSNKYGNVFYRVETTTGQQKYLFTSDVKVILASNALVVDGVSLESWKNETTEVTIPASKYAESNLSELFLAHILEAIGSFISNNDDLTAPKISSNWNFALRVVLRGDNIFQTKHFNGRKMRSGLIADLVTGLDQVTHLGTNMQLPVVQVQSDSPRIQFTHSTFWELVVEDSSPFTIDIVAGASNNKDSVKKGEFNRYVNIMKGMPPALEFTDGNLSEFAASQLQTRGIFGDIANFLGPVIGTIFPPAKPFVGIAQNLISTLEG